MLHHVDNKNTYLLLAKTHVWQYSGIMVDDHTVWALNPLHLMSHQVTALVVHVIGHNKPFYNKPGEFQRGVF